MTERLKEILNKLIHLKRMDRGLQIFGADSHKYNSNKVSLAEVEFFERQNQIKLPSEFKDFLVYIGIGAGPDYGIYSLTQMAKEYKEWAFFLDENSRLSNQCDLKNIDAIELIQNKQNDPKGFHYKRLKNANGILPIETQGCTYYCFIILNGEQVGKIWAADSNEFNTLPGGTIQEFFFLDWYENWLDKSIAKLSNPINETPVNGSKKESGSWWRRFFS